LIRPLADFDPRALPFLQNCADRSHGRYTAEGLMMNIMSRDMQAYVINDWQALCITSVGENHVFLHGLVGENSHEWRDDLEVFLRAWAKALGKKWIIGLCRPGWVPWAKSRGWVETHREIALEV